MDLFPSGPFSARTDRLTAAAEAVSGVCEEDLNPVFPQRTGVVPQAGR